MLLKKKFTPSKFKGSIEEIPLPVIIDYISFTCFLSIKKGDDTGALFFKNGVLINARINNNFHIEKAKDILKLKEGDFFYQKWIDDFEIEHKYLSDILHLIEFCGFDTELSFIFDDEFIKIVCSEGIIVDIEPEQKNLESFFKNILEETKGNIRIKSKGAQTGDFKIYISEITDSALTNKKTRTKPLTNLNNKPAEKIKVSDNNTINKDILIQSLNALKNTLKDGLLAGSIYKSSSGNPLYSLNIETNQAELFAKMHKTISSLLNDAKFSKINNYYLLNLEDNYLLFILIFKNHHIALIFNKTKIKLGYLLSILKPLLINDYEKSINN